MNEYLKILVNEFTRSIPKLANHYVGDYFQNRAKDRMIELDNKKFEKLRLMLDKRSRKQTVTTPTNDKLTSGFLQDESIEDLGRRKWKEYENHLTKLPDNAPKPQVQRALREIEQNIRIYPCTECREQALENLEKLPLVDNSVTTKTEAQKRLCSFHNEVRNTLGQPIVVNCERIS